MKYTTSEGEHILSTDVSLNKNVTACISGNIVPMTAKAVGTF